MLSYHAEGFTAQDCPSLVGAARLKESCADFVVEEIPAYEPSGAGEHLFVWLQKEGMAAEVLMRHVARTLQIDTSEIGCAGLKDTRAITRQYISVPAATMPHLAALDNEHVTVLGHALHGNKLKTGHLKGNRFSIRIPDQSPDNAARAAVIAEHLTKHGFANFYGPQRFGGGDTLELGLALLAAGPKNHLPNRKVSRMLRRLALSSVQSALFNQVLNKRLAHNILHTVLTGDVCLVRVSGGPFVSDDAARETQRLKEQEIVTAGPMFGPKMRAAQGEALALELEVLQSAGLGREMFRGYGKLLQGTRRANIVWPQGLALTYDAAETLTLTFELPPGSYATVLLREFWRQAPQDVELKRQSA